jgi:hypothetical protein
MPSTIPSLPDFANAKFPLAEMAERCHWRRHRSALTSGTQISVTKSVVYDLLGLA